MFLSLLPCYQCHTQPAPSNLLPGEKFRKTINNKINKFYIWLLQTNAHSYSLLLLHGEQRGTWSTSFEHGLDILAHDCTVAPDFDPTEIVSRKCQILLNSTVYIIDRQRVKNCMQTNYTSDIIKHVNHSWIIS